MYRFTKRDTIILKTKFNKAPAPLLITAATLFHHSLQIRQAVHKYP